jgi:hypothetical protein
MPPLATLHVLVYPSFQGSLWNEEVNLPCDVEWSLQKSSPGTNFSLSRNLDMYCVVGRAHRITYNTYPTFNLSPPISVTSRSFYSYRRSGPAMPSGVYELHVTWSTCVSENSGFAGRTSLVSDTQQHISGSPLKLCNFGVNKSSVILFKQCMSF